ncbi:MAG TPA: RNA polymerase sigma-70 factor [Chitinophaga sp.]
MEMERDQLPGEAALVGRLREGDETAFREIYNFYWHRQYRLALFKLGNREVAEELTQEIFTSLWLRRHVLDSTQPIARYLFGAMRNQILNVYRKNVSHDKYLTEITRQSGPQLIADDPFEQIMSADLYRAIMQQLDQLPDKCREVVLLSRVKGYSIQQIAEELRISPKTVNNHMVKGLKVLRLTLRNILPFALWLWLFSR